MIWSDTGQPIGEVLSCRRDGNSLHIEVRYSERAVDAVLGRKCCVCGNRVGSGRRSDRVLCSDACKSKAYRARKRGTERRDWE